MAPANMSWIVARRLAALAVTAGLLLLPATVHAAAIDRQRDGATAVTRDQVAGNDFDNSIPTFSHEKPIDSVNEASGFMIRCYCNMPACLAATGGVRTCTTRLGCFSQLQPNLPNLDGTVTHSIATTTTQKITTLIPEEFDVEAAIYGNDNALNGDYGCLDLLPTNKTCDEVLKSMERDESEFPFIQKGSSSQSVDNVMSAYHCCEEDMCNDRSHVAASATNAEASLIAAFENSMSLVKDVPKKTTTTTTTTEETWYMPIPIALVSGRKKFFVNVRNIAPDIFPSSDNSKNTRETNILLSKIKDKASFTESTQQIVPTNNVTTPTIFDTFSSSLMSNTNATSNETIITSKINATSTEINTNVTFTEANLMINYTTETDTETVKNITSSSMAIDSEKNNTTTIYTMRVANENNITSTEATSTVNTNVTFFEANLMVNTTTANDPVTIKNITSSFMDVDFEKNNTTATSTILIANENNNTISTDIDSNDNSKSPLLTENTYNENNVTSSLIDIDVTTITTLEILNTVTPNISEIIVSDSNATSSAPSIIINTTEVITSKTGTEQKQENLDQFFRVMIRRQDSPKALAFHKSPEEKTVSVATLLELDSTKSPDDSESFTVQENNAHVPMDPSYNRHWSVDETHRSAAVDVTASSGFFGLDWTRIPQWVEGVTGILAICGIIGVAIVALAAIKIVRKTDVFEHYQSVCSNPGQPCACNGGRGRRGSRQLTSSSTVYRNTTTSIQPALPPPNNSLYGLAYVDSTGNSTHVYTPIPVPL